MNFSETVRSARLRAGLTQRELADITGISLRTITNYENAKCLPRSKYYYRKLGEALSLDPDYLESLPAASLFLYNQKSPCTAAAQELRIFFSQFMADTAMSERDKDLLMCELERAYWKSRGLDQPFS